MHFLHWQGTLRLRIGLRRSRDYPAAGCMCVEHLRSQGGEVGQAKGPTGQPCCEEEDSAQTHGGEVVVQLQEWSGPTITSACGRV